MVKIPVGKQVEVNLWNRSKKHGMVKYYTNTMDLVRAESEFDLNKGDSAYVIESYDSFVVIVPEDNFSRLLYGNQLESINIEGLNQAIYQLLQDRVKESGGILSLDELLSILSRTSIQGVITKQHIKKALKVKNASFDRIKFNGQVFAGLKPHEMVTDLRNLRQLGKSQDYLTKNVIQTKFGWTDIRMERLLNYLISQKQIRQDDSYRSGQRYFFNMGE